MSACWLHAQRAWFWHLLLTTARNSESAVLVATHMLHVQGPVISDQQAGGVSVGFMKGILESEASKEFKGSWIVNDVRDVAAAHILAAEEPAAKGRCVRRWRRCVLAVVTAVAASSGDSGARKRPAAHASWAVHLALLIRLYSSHSPSQGLDCSAVWVPALFCCSDYTIKASLCTTYLSCCCCFRFKVHVDQQRRDVHSLHRCFKPHRGISFAPHV